MIPDKSGLRLADFLYSLPEELIAQGPAPSRSGSRLMKLHRRSGVTEDLAFSALPHTLGDTDLLVVNDIKVFPARLMARRRTGGRVEVFLLNFPESNIPVRCLVNPARKIRAGEELILEDGTTVTLDRTEDGFTVMANEDDLADAVWRVGQVPLPPYIKREGNLTGPVDRERYQTVYAQSPGAVAAPTAGLHFDEDLLAGLDKKGVEVVPITLKVGLGTFSPVRVDNISAHHMESEDYEISPDSAEAINRARAEGRRVVAVGTTVVRTLESAVKAGMIHPGRGSSDLFIYPGYRFRTIDALVTNFHLPGSTLLMLVCAFAGTKNVLSAYAEAVRLKYRFYSYGDAMLIE